MSELPTIPSLYKSRQNFKEPTSTGSLELQPGPVEPLSVPVRFRSKPRFPTQILSTIPERSKNTILPMPRTEAIKLSSGNLIQELKKIEEAIVGFKSFPSRHQNDSILLSIFELLEHHFAKLPGFRTVIDFLFDATFIKTTNSDIEQIYEAFLRRDEMSSKVLPSQFDSVLSNFENSENNLRVETSTDQNLNCSSKLKDIKRVQWAEERRRSKSENTFGFQQESCEYLKNDTQINTQSQGRPDSDNQPKLEMSSFSKSEDKIRLPPICRRDKSVTITDFNTFRTSKPSIFNQNSATAKQQLNRIPSSGVISDQNEDGLAQVTKEPFQRRPLFDEQVYHLNKTSTENYDLLKKNDCPQQDCSNSCQNSQLKDPLSSRGLQSFRNITFAVICSYKKLLTRHSQCSQQSVELAQSSINPQNQLFKQDLLVNIVHQFEDSDFNNLQTKYASMQMNLISIEQKLSTMKSERDSLLDAHADLNSKLADTKEKLSAMFHKHSSLKKEHENLTLKATKYKNYCRKTQLKYAELKKIGKQFCNLLTLKLKQLASCLALDWPPLSSIASQPSEKVHKKVLITYEPIHQASNISGQAKIIDPIKSETSNFHPFRSLNKLDEACQNSLPLLERKAIHKPIRRGPTQFYQT